jgi:8-amino-7-oxononanoate synthase
VLLRPHRGRHSRKGTCPRYPAARLTTHSLPLFIRAKLAAQVLEHSAYLQERLRASLAASSIPAHILALPARLQQQHQQPSMAQPITPIVPLLTPRARALSAHLLAHGLNARPISWPTVPKGMDRVRVCLHAGNTRAEIDGLINASIAWAGGIAQPERAWPDGGRTRIEECVGGMGSSGSDLLGAKL